MRLALNPIFPNSDFCRAEKCIRDKKKKKKKGKKAINSSQRLVSAYTIFMVIPYCVDTSEILFPMHWPMHRFFFRRLLFQFLIKLFNSYACDHLPPSTLHPLAETYRSSDGMWCCSAAMSAITLQSAALCIESPLHRHSSITPWYYTLNRPLFRRLYSIFIWFREFSSHSRIQRNQFWLPTKSLYQFIKFFRNVCSVHCSHCSHRFVFLCCICRLLQHNAIKTGHRTLGVCDSTSTTTSISTSSSFSPMNQVLSPISHNEFFLTSFFKSFSHIFMAHKCTKSIDEHFLVHVHLSNIQDEEIYHWF